MDAKDFRDILEEAGLSDAQMQEILYHFDLLKTESVEDENKRLERIGSNMRVARLDSESVGDWRSRAADIARKISDYYDD